jgi:hypothetical protein
VPFHGKSCLLVKIKELILNQILKSNFIASRRSTGFGIKDSLRPESASFTLYSASQIAPYLSTWEVSLLMGCRPPVCRIPLMQCVWLFGVPWWVSFECWSYILWLSPEGLYIYIAHETVSSISHWEVIHHLALRADSNHTLL